MRTAVVWTLGTALLLVSAPAPAAPTTEADECIEAAEHAQSLRRDGKLIDAHEQLLSCSRASCPRFVRADCLRWIDEVRAATPSVILAVTDPTGHDIADVRVSVDGRSIADRLDGGAIPLDPGEHRIRYERAGSQTVEDHVVVRQSEKGRVLRVVLKPVMSPTTSAPSEHATRRSVPTSSWLIGGAGVAVLGVGAVLWGIGLSERATLDDRCARTHSCSHSDVVASRQKLVVGDALVGAGVVAIGIAVYLALTSDGARDRGATAASSMGLRPWSGR